MEFQNLEKFPRITYEKDQLNLSTENLDLNSLNIQNLEKTKDKLKNILVKMNLEKLKMHRLNDDEINESNENRGLIFTN